MREREREREKPRGIPQPREMKNCDIFCEIERGATADGKKERCVLGTWGVERADWAHGQIGQGNDNATRGGVRCGCVE